MANLTLDGLEELIKKVTPRRTRVNCVRYADDFIVTAKSKTLLTEKIKPTIEEFLNKRGLKLSKEKTKITHIKKGFTFLGQTFRKRGNKLRIIPAKEGVASLQKKVKGIIDKNVSAPLEGLIKTLNPVLRGWGNYHRHIISSETFYEIDKYVYNQIWRMLRKRHNNKSRKWLFNKYWSVAGKNHVFTVVTKYKDKSRLLKVFKLQSIDIQKYLRIRVNANPYLPEYHKYFWIRKFKKGSKLMGELSFRPSQELKSYISIKHPGYYTTVTLEMLELYEGKLSRTVLRGEENSNVLALPGGQKIILLKYAYRIR